MAADARDCWIFRKGCKDMENPVIGTGSSRKYRYKAKKMQGWGV